MKFAINKSEDTLEASMDSRARAAGSENLKDLYEGSWQTYFESLFEYFDFSDTAKKVGDIGCGTGMISKQLFKMGFRVLGADLSSEVIKLAKQFCPECQFKKGSVYSIPFGSNSFDTVLCLGVLQTVGELPRALLELSRITKPGGILIIRTLNSLSLSNKKDIGGAFMKCYNPLLFKKELGQAGFSEVKIKGIYVFPKPFAFLDKFILKSKIYKILNYFFPVAAPFCHSVYFQATKK